MHFNVKESKSNLNAQLHIELQIECSICGTVQLKPTENINTFSKNNRF